ncbi:MAG: GNAT family N-acetyltransferase [Candidatus Peribacteraceae bacterium]
MTIRQYQESDHTELARLIRILQEHIAALDPLERQITGTTFDANVYIDLLIERIERETGVIFVAETDGKLVGFVAGTIQQQDEDPAERLAAISSITGRVLELVVDSTYRSRSIGTELMETMEKYFHKNDCILVRVNCFAPNAGAHAFYEKLGYSDRAIDLVKMLE